MTRSYIVTFFFIWILEKMLVSGFLNSYMNVLMMTDPIAEVWRVKLSDVVTNYNY